VRFSFESERVEAERDAGKEERDVLPLPAPLEFALAVVPFVGGRYGRVEAMSRARTLFRQGEIINTDVKWIS
jgi:hypothetical protein